MKKRRDVVLSERENAFVKAHKGDATKAAVAAGYKNPSVAGHRLMKRPRVKEALEERNTAAFREMGRIIGKTIAKADVTARLLKLADLAPAKTNNNITGQVNALRLIADMESYIIRQHQNVTELLKGKTEEETEFFCQHGYFPDSNEPLRKAESSTQRSESRSAGGVKPN